MPRGRPVGTAKASGTNTTRPEKDTSFAKKTKILRSADEVLAEANFSPVMLATAVSPGEIMVHRQLLLLEFNSPLLLEEVLGATLLGNYVVRRLGPTALMVDHERQEEVVKLLTKKGYEPKITRV